MGTPNAVKNPELSSSSGPLLIRIISPPRAGDVAITSCVCCDDDVVDDNAVDLTLLDTTADLNA